MTSKFVIAGGIPERRIRPIWDAVDSRQFKNAYKLVQVLVAKYPNFPYALALKALILERLGKSDEALCICSSAKESLCSGDTSLADDLTLSTLQIVSHRLGCLDLATSCYEYVCAKISSKELMIGLFSCYVQEQSFVKQQQTAIKMYKNFGEERFLLWAVCSIQLQFINGDGGEKLLLLAEGLLRKHIRSHGLHEIEGLIVYVSILEKQGKYLDALEALSRKSDSLLMIDSDRLQLQGRLLALAGDYDAAVLIFQKVLELSPDNWQCFICYLCCLLEDGSFLKDGSGSNEGKPQCHAGGMSSHLLDEELNCRLSSALAFVRKLQAETSSDQTRCPHLAVLEIQRCLILYGKGDDEKLMDEIIRYFSRFGYLSCFTSDVEVFVQILCPDRKTQLLDKLVNSKELLSTEPRKLVGQLTTTFKMQELIGYVYKMPVSSLLDYAINLIDIYFENLPLSKDLDVQECMYGEELLSLTCNVLVQLFWRTSHIGYLFEAVLILEFGLTVRRYVSQYKISLVHLYHELGAISSAYEWYKSLDVKNILLESVLHNILPQILQSPLWTELNDIMKEYLKFMNDYLRESADLTFMAYQHRNYSKVVEFVRFKDRLVSSSQFLAVKIEESIMQRKQGADNDVDAFLESLGDGNCVLELPNNIGGEALTLNDDIQIRPWWTPIPFKNYLTEPFKEVSFYCYNNKELEREWKPRVWNNIEKRSLLPRLIYLSIQSVASSPTTKSKVGTNGSINILSMSEELKVLLGRYANLFGFSFGDAIKVLVGISISQTPSQILDLNLVDWLNFAVFYEAWNMCLPAPGQQIEAGNGSNGWDIVDSLLKMCVSELIGPGNLATIYGIRFPKLVQLITESLSWHGLVIRSYVRSYSANVKKKKKKSGLAEQTGSPHLCAAGDSVLTMCSILEQVVEWAKKEICKTENGYLETLISSVHKDPDEGPGRVLRALKTCITSMNDTEVGPRIAEAVNRWNPVDIARKTVAGYGRVLYEFLRICELKSKSMYILRQQILLL